MINILFKIVFFAIPIFIAVPLLYLLAELYFVNAFINTYSTSTNIDGLENYEIVGRAVSAIGVSLSVVIAYSTKQFVRQGWDFDYSALIWESLKAFFKAFFVSLAGIYVLTKALIFYIDSPEARFCAGQGHYIKSQVQRGAFSPLASWNDQQNYMNINHHQVALTMLPYSFCTNDIVRNEVLANPDFKQKILQDFFNTVFEQSQAYQQYTKFVDGRHYIDSDIGELYKAYQYIIANNEKMGNRAFRKVRKSISDNKYEDEIMKSFAWVALNDRERGGSRSLSDFKRIFKSKLAIEVSGIKLRVSGWWESAKAIFGDDFVLKNISYFEVSEPKGVFPNDYFDKKLQAYALQKFILDTAKGSLDDEVDSNLYDSVEGMVMPVIVLAISALSMLLLVVNVVISCFRLVIYHNPLLAWLVDVMGGKKITPVLMILIVLAGVTYLFMLSASLLFMVVVISCLALALIYINKLLLAINSAFGGRVTVPTILKEDSEESITVQALTHPVIYLTIILVSASALPPSTSERILLTNESDGAMKSLIKVGARLQFYAFPFTINFYKALGVNPWLPHQANMSSIAAHWDSLHDANSARRLLTPIYDSVAWHALVLANHERLTEQSAEQIRSMFAFYRGKDKYQQQARYADDFIKYNVKIFE